MNEPLNTNTVEEVQPTETTNVSENKQENSLLPANFKNVLELIKEISGIAGTISAVIGAATLWWYCKNLDLITTLANTEDVGYLIVYFVLGYILIFGSILFTSILVPSAIMSLNDDLLSLGHIDWEKAGKDKISGYLRWYWFGMLLFQFIGTGMGLGLQIFTECKYAVALCFLVMITTNGVFLNSIYNQYQKLKNKFDIVDENTNQQITTPQENRWMYIGFISVLLILAILPFFIVVSLVAGLQVDWNDKEWWEWAVIAVTGVLSIGGYSFMMGFLIVPYTQKNYEKRYFIAILLGLVLTLAVHYLNFQGILNIAAQTVGIQTPTEEKKLYVYRFKKEDIENELRTFSNEEYAVMGTYIYVKGYSIFNFRKTLVFCPSSVAVKNLSIDTERAKCIDMSGFEFKRFNAVNYGKMFNKN